MKYYANFFSAHRVPSPPYSQAVIWFYVLQILKCLHGGFGQLNKQQLSPISGGQLLTKKAQGNQGKQRKGKQQSGRERESVAGPRVCGIVANLSSRESRGFLLPLPLPCCVCRPRKLTISRRITQLVQSFSGALRHLNKSAICLPTPRPAAMRC